MHTAGDEEYGLTPQVYIWGSNMSYQVGGLKRDDFKVPKLILTGDDIRAPVMAISAGFAASALIQSEKKLMSIKKSL